MFKIAVVGGEYHRLLKCQNKHIKIFDAWKPRHLKALQAAKYFAVIVINDHVGHAQFLRVRRFANCKIIRCAEKNLDTTINSLYY